MIILKSKLFILLFIQILITPFFIKINNLNIISEKHGEDTLYTIWQVSSHDSIILLLIVFLCYLSYQQFINYIIAVILRLISLILFLLYITDILTLMYLYTHITIIDFLKYADEALAFTLKIYNLNTLVIWPFITFILLCILFLLRQFSITKIKIHLLYLTIFIFLLIAYISSSNGNFVQAWVYKNYLEYNYEIHSQNKEYQKTYLNQEEIKCITNTQTNKNIIILMVESLSSYQSNYFSGIKNWTPNLDNIVKENTALTNFHANGFTTEDAMIAILTGIFPLYAPDFSDKGRGFSFNGFYNLPNTLPKLFNKNNFNTEFIHSSDLMFSNVGEWGKSIGFNYIEGSEHSYYNNKKRYYFKSVADEYLYDRIIDRINKQDKNFFIFAATMSSHAPFINPEDDSRSEEKTIKYVDKQIGIFYSKLKKMNFFENGILFILGDHHPMIPIKKEEIAHYGIEKVVTATPMIIVNNKKSKINLPFGQTNLYDSIKNSISKEYCSSLFKGDFLSKISEPKYILHRKGDERNLVTVFENSLTYKVKLDGDDTKILNKQQNNEVINKINYIRTQRNQEKYKYKN